LWRIVRLPAQFSTLAFASALAFSPAPAAFSAPAASQNYLIHTWKTDDGLPQNWVSNIVQTPEGYLWIGTRYGGLARFDGMRFVPFNPQNTPALQDVQVEHLSTDAEGRLWIMMGNESITTFRNNTFRLHRGPRTDPRMRLDRVLATPRPGEILFAGETSFVARAQFTPSPSPHPSPSSNPSTRSPPSPRPNQAGATVAWTIHDPRPEIEIDQSTLRVDRDGVAWALAASGKIVRFENGHFTFLPAAAFAFAPPAAAAAATSPAAAAAGLTQGQALRAAAATAVTAIAADDTRTIWAATPERLLRWDDSCDCFTDVTPSGDPAPQSITQIAFSGDNGLWVLEKTRLRKFLDGRWVAEIDNAQLLRHAAGNTSLRGDAQGNLWLVNYGRGLWHAKSDGAATLLDEHSGLPSLFITCWHQDTEGNIWVGTTGGIARIRESIFTTFGPAQGLPAEIVSSVCIDAQGTLWAGTMTDGLISWKDGRFEKHPLPASSRPSPFAGLTVAPADDGGVWIGSVSHGLMRLHNGQIFKQKAWQDVRVLFGDSRGTLWVGPLADLYSLRNGRVIQYGIRRGFENGRAIGAMAEDGAGAIWIGTGPGDLWKYKDGSFTKYTPPPEWPAARISAVLPEHDGATVWIGTLGGGLLRFHDGAFTRCTAENGLPDNNISQLLDSGDGDLWAGTYSGIFRAGKDELARAAANKTATATVRIYGRFDGLPALECTSGFQPACWRSGDGTLYFATANGVAAVNPRHVIENKIPPSVLIEELIVDGKRLEIPSPARHAPAVAIAPGQHHVQFQVTALNFAAPDSVRFRVKLDNADAEWRNVDSRRLIGYGPLLPGKYRFHVTACNNDGVWNETGDALAFEVLPHYYETVWFRNTLGLVLLGAIVFTVARTQRQRYRRRLQRLEHQRALEHERTRIAHDLHDDLGANLTQISLLSALASRDQPLPAETRDCIRQMDDCAHNMVTALDEIVWAVNPKNDSWYELANYLGTYAEKFFQNTGIRCWLDISERIPSRAIPSETRHHIFLAVKEALNNAARHSGASRVWLRIKISETSETTMIIQVEDDGCGFPRTATANSGASADATIACANAVVTAAGTNAVVTATVTTAATTAGATPTAAATAATSGNGLRNMRHRMLQVGGTLDISAAASHTAVSAAATNATVASRGVAVTFQVPLGESPAD
jgi:signal transduction histidine kinase/ligand-binding sensor domain-containing protein